MDRYRYARYIQYRQNILYGLLRGLLYYYCPLFLLCVALSLCALVTKKSKRYKAHHINFSRVCLVTYLVLGKNALGYRGTNPCCSGYTRRYTYPGTQSIYILRTLPNTPTFATGFPTNLAKLCAPWYIQDGCIILLPSENGLVRSYWYATGQKKSAPLRNTNGAKIRACVEPVPSYLPI